MPAEQAAVRTLIDELLDEQSKLQTPVARFAEQHSSAPDLADHYRDLIPLTAPGAGERYAFEVALDRCTGCKACVSACHSLNGLDDDESWRDTGVLLGGPAAPAWQQTVTTACHHCEDPGCLNGCPVGAYEKDPVTGIVRHLDDQCIGCSYCILKCPYDVPKYSKKRGIVRKCDMCHQRLARGEAPACVQACPTEAIRIIKIPVNRDPVIRQRGINILSPLHDPRSALPESSITLPTTRYVGREVPATAHSADRSAQVPQHAHWPLALMLTFTQAGIGLSCMDVPTPDIRFTMAGAVLFYLGMGASVLHLGQPLKAWRFFLGLRTSWLSREILAFSLLSPIPATLATLPLLPDFPFKDALVLLTSLSAPPLALLAVFTSVMIYHDTRRALWRLPRTALRFFGTVVVFTLLAHPLALTIAMLTLKLIPEVLFLRGARAEEWSPDTHSARLQSGPLRPVFTARISLAALAIMLAWMHPLWAVPALLGAELLERLLFFRSVQAPKMPGHFGPAPH